MGTAQIAQAQQDRDEKAETKAKKLEAKADAEGDLAETTATRDADVKYLDDLTATCTQKAADFESRQKLRGEELVAIEKAIEIISSSEVSGNADKYLPTFVQVKSSSLASLRSDLSTATRMDLVAYLRAQGKKINSRVLIALADRAQ